MQFVLLFQQLHEIEPREDQDIPLAGPLLLVYALWCHVKLVFGLVIWLTRVWYARHCSVPSLLHMYTLC